MAGTYRGSLIGSQSRFRVVGAGLPRYHSIPRIPLSCDTIHPETASAPQVRGSARLTAPTPSPDASPQSCASDPACRVEGPSFSGSSSGPEWLTLLRDTFTGLLRHGIKEMDQQSKEERHRARSGEGTELPVLPRCHSPTPLGG